MATTGTLDLRIWRNDDVYEYPLRVIGPNLTGAAMRAQVRLYRDAPGAALVDLETVTSAVEGIRLVGAVMVDDEWVNDVRIRIDKATRQALPYAGEMGDNTVLAWAMQIGGRTRLVGQVVMLAHAIDSDAAPINRSAGPSSSGSGYPTAGTTVTIANDDVAEIRIDGAGEANRAQEAADAAIAAAAVIGSARFSVATNLLSDTTTSAQAFNGATIVSSGGKQVGIAIPSGQTGQNSLAQARIPIDGATRAGATVRVTLAATLSGTFTRTLARFLAVRKSNGTTAVPSATIVRDTQSAGRRILVYDYVVQADDVGLWPYFQTTTATATGAVETFTLDTVTWGFTANADPVLSPADLNLAVNNARTVNQAVTAGLFNAADDFPASVSAQLFNGATAIASGSGQTIGFAIPTGQTGRNSIFQPIMPIAGAKYAGATVQIAIAADLSATFTRAPTFGMQVRVAGANVSRSATVLTAMVGSGKLVYLVNYVMQGDETDLRPFFQLSATAATAADESITFTGATWKAISAATSGRTAPQLNADGFRSAIALSILSPSAPRIIRVKDDGTGDFTTIAAALAATSGATASDRYAIQIYEKADLSGYEEVNLFCRDYVDLIGIGETPVWIDGHLPDDVAVATIPQTQTLWFYHQATLHNLKITAKNMRYPIHADSVAMSGKTLRTLACHIEHLGNQGARDYQTSIGADPNAVWNSLCAWGSGIWDGATFDHLDTEFVSPGDPYLVHDATTAQSRPAMVRISGGVIDATGSGARAIVAQSYGSQQINLMQVRDGTTITGTVDNQIVTAPYANWRIIGA